ncbi:MAG: hypothetical protein AAF799_32360 [Myxococcota bacterium]
MSAIPGIPPESRASFKTHHDAPLVTADALRAELGAYARDLTKRTDDNELVDAGLGRALTRACTGLIDRTESADESTRRLVQGAVRYFIDEDDAEPDRDSLWGLDDDVAVCNAVARHLGHEDLIVNLG